MGGNNSAMFEPKVVPAGRGASWLFESFEFFTKDWPAWLGVTIILFLLTLLVSIIPLVNLVFIILLPTFFAGFMLGCKEQEQGDEFMIGHLFTGFTRNFVQLLILGVLHTVGLLIIAICMGGILVVLLGGMDAFLNTIGGLIDAFMGKNFLQLIEQISNFSQIILIADLVGLALYMPLLMLVWFAPALVALADQTAIEAMKNSFTGCLLNVMPYTIYGLVGLVLSILATLPLAVGWLILFPVTTISIYLSYQDVFESTAE